MTLDMPVRSNWIGSFVAACAIALVCAAPARAQAPLTQNQGPNLGTWLVGPLDLQLSASGGAGNGTYVWSLISGSLPPGVALRTDVPSWFSPSANAGLIGVATTPGTYPFTLRVTSGGQTSDRAYTWRITGLTLQDLNLPDAFAGRFYSYKFTAVNNAGPVTFSANSPLPAGMSLASDGTLSGTPPTAGFFNVDVRFTDGVDSVSQGRAFAVSAIRVFSDAEIAFGVLPNATQGSPYATLVKASGGAGGYTFSSCPGNTVFSTCAAGSASLPAGLNLDSAGAITGTPTAGPGKYSFTVTATDTNHVSYSRMMSIDIIGTPPTLPNISPYGGFFDDCSFGDWCATGMGANNGGTAPFTWTATGLPAGMGIRFGSTADYWITPGDGQLWGHPMPASFDPFTVQVTVTDAAGNSTSNTFPMHVSPMSLRDFLSNGTIGVPYSSKLRVAGGRLPYTAVLKSGNIPAGLTFDATTFTLSGIPLENSQNFSFDPVFLFTDADGKTLERHSYFTIAADASSTIAMNNFWTLGSRTLNVFTSIQLTACCLPSFTWSQVGGTLPPGMTFSSDGILSGTPTSEGTFQFLIKAADPTNPANTAIRQFTLSVTSFSPSTANFTLPFANVGTVYSTPLAGTGVTGLTWTFTPRTYPPPGLSVDPTTGVLQGTPQSAGQFFFSVDITDGAGRTATRNFGISVYRAGETPPLNLNISSTFGPLVKGTFTQQLNGSGGQPPYHYSLTPGSSNVPGMRVQDGQPLPTFFSSTGGYIGVLADSGTFQTSLRVTDATGAFFDRPITFIVSPLTTTSQTSLPKATVNAPYAFDIVPDGGSGNYSLSLVSGSVLPPGLSMNSAGHISGTPTTFGSFSFNVAVTDLTTSETIALFHSLTINPFAIETNGVLPRGVVGVPYTPVTLSAPGCGAGCVWSALTVQGNLTLSSDGVLSGTPAGTSVGFFTIQATGSAGTVQKVFTLQVLSAALQPLAITATSIGPSVVGNLITTALFAQGGAPPYTWSLQSGTLPPGITLQFPGETIGFGTGPGLAYLAGRANTPGVYTFTLATTDANGATATRTLTWNISRLNFQYTNLPILNTPQINNPLVYNTPYTQPLLVIGGTGSYTWTPLNALPPGLSVSGSGIVSGTPTNTGSISSQIQATDTAGNTNTSFLNFNIAGPTTTVLGFNSGPSLGNFQQGLAFRFNISPFGGTPPYTITQLSPLPAGFAIESDDALLGTDLPGSVFFAGIPQAPGLYSFTLKAQDSANNIGVRTFTYAVIPSTLFSSTALADGSVGVPYSQAIRVLNGAATTWTVAPSSGMPPGLSVSPAGVISGTPTAPGSYSFVLSMNDATFGTTNNFTFSLRISRIAIADANVLPQIAVVGQPFSYPFTGSGAANIVWSAINLPNGLTMSSTGTISGTPQSVGTFSVLVTATDGLVALSRRVTLFVRLPNATPLDYPLASTTLNDVTVGQSGSVTLTPSGGIPPYSWSIAAGSTLPPGMQLIAADINLPNFIQGAGVLVGTPTTAGVYSFDLVITDSAAPSNTVRRTFTLNVTPINLLAGAPRNATMGVAYSERFTTTGGTGPYTYTLEPASIGQDALPPGLALSSDGVISGTPTSTGNYGFRIRVRDAATHTFSRTNTLVVNSTSGLRVTSGNPSDAWVGESDRSLFLSTSGSSTYSWSLVSGSLPPGVSLVPDSGSASLLGSPSGAGVFTFALRAVDNAASGNTADHVFTYRVTPFQPVAPNDLGVRALPAGEVGAPYSFTFKLAGGAQPYSVTASSFTPLPPGLSFTGTTLSGTPQSAGSFVLQPIFSDGAGNALNGSTLNLTVTPAGATAPLVRPNTGTEDLPPGSVGVPYILPLSDLNFITRGGRAPFTWTIAPGSALPPGLTLLAGGNGLSTLLGGVPTAVGGYAFSLVVSDASGQSLTVPFEQDVSTLTLTPAPILSLPVGTVGVPYSTSLVPSGGTAPYTIQLDRSSGMPPGLSLSAAGLLAGTPTAPGSFQLEGALSDATGNSTGFFYVIDVDNAAGEAPVVKVTPNPLQIFYTTGSPAPAPIPVAVTTTSGSASFNAMLSGVAGATLSASTGTTSAIVNVNLAVGALAVGTYQGVLAVKAPDAVMPFDATPVTITVVAPPPCTYSLNPPTSTMPSTGGAGTFDVIAGPGCSWTLTAPPPSLVTITSGAAGIGSGTVRFTAVANTNTAARNLLFNVAGQTHTLTQFGSACSFAISPTKLPVTAAGGTATITVTPSQSSCAWTASGLGATPTSGTGGGSVTVTIPPNPGLSTVTMSATIATKTLNVTQSGIACTIGLSPYNASASAAGGPGSIAITTPTGCSYDTTSVPSWIKVTSGGSGAASDTLLYSVDPNSTTTPRVGTMTIGGQPFEITQNALACSLTIDTSALGSPYGVTGGVGQIGITANGSNCSWTASSNATWATVTPTSSSGNGTVGITVQSNGGSPTSRAAALTIAGQTINVSQAGLTCTYALQSANGSVPAAGATGAVGVVAPNSCGWTATPDPLAPWLTISSAAAAGSGDVNFVAQPNTAASSRTGTLTIAGLPYTVTQAPAPCSYTLGSSNVTVASTGAAGSFTFSAATGGCTPTPVSYASWITASTPAPGTIGYTVVANPTSSTRVGTIRIGEQNFTVTQTGGACGFSLNSYSALFGPAGDTTFSRTVFGSPSALGCSPDYGTNQNFITLGSLSGPTSNIFTLPYIVAPLNSLTPTLRFGNITFGGQIFVVKQTSY